MKKTLKGFLDRLEWLPGIISYVWIGLTLLMLIAAYLLYKPEKKHTKEGKLIYLMLLLTWLYPLYSWHYRLIPGFIGTIFYYIYLFYAGYRIYQKDVKAALLLLPTVIWVTFAICYTLAKIIVR